MLSIPQLVATVREFDPQGDDRSRRSRQSTLDLLRQGECALARTHYSPGHVTASAVVLSPDRTQVLLVHHRKLGRWLQPGGHIEPGDRSTEEAAAREVLEETGVAVLPGVDPDLVGVDVHEIPAWGDEPAHLHHDVVWRLPASGSDALSPGVMWCPILKLSLQGIDPPLLRAVERATRVP